MAKKALVYMRFDCIPPEFSPFRNFLKNIGKLNSLTVHKKKKKKKKKKKSTDRPNFQILVGWGQHNNFFFGLMYNVGHNWSGSSNGVFILVSCLPRWLMPETDLSELFSEPVIFYHLCPFIHGGGGGAVVMPKYMQPWLFFYFACYRPICVA